MLEGTFNKERPKSDCETSRVLVPALISILHPAAACRVCKEHDYVCKLGSVGVYTCPGLSQCKSIIV